MDTVDRSVKEQVGKGVAYAYGLRRPVTPHDPELCSWCQEVRHVDGELCAGCVKLLGRAE